MMCIERKLFLLRCLCDDYQKLNEIQEAVEDVFGSYITESPFFKPIWELFDHSLDSVVSQIGDEGEWVRWFIYENDCGKKGYKAGLGNDLNKIKTVEELLELIEGNKQKENE
jgi:hypothetical protein